ncbi:HAD-IA family hydrolase [Thalassospira lucentensis]|uniref:HAD-IA family hydrolase n=1 Tax=Thalassospira lucentensis TaxID=168935 RepID=UPI0003B56888|nr:HAD-IA family hydrolase [Thalassospira lucentensis]RCK21162.1 haloacid dehalogenase [Thalassospira lucentensis MCCC 1A00383 = DSM 14000]
MANDPLRLVVFDCDGTLVDSQHAIAHCMDHAFAQHGLDCPGLENTRTIIGLSLPEAIAKLAAPRRVTDEVIDAVTAAYKDAFFTLRQTPDFHEPLFPGVREVLSELDRRQWLLGVATGKARRGLDAVLARNELDGRFVTLQTCDNHPSKPHPSMLMAALDEAGADAPNAVIVGDTSYDIEMGRAAGMIAIGVAWGYHDIETLTASGAHAVIRHFDELPSVLDRIWEIDCDAA